MQHNEVKDEETDITAITGLLNDPSLPVSEQDIRPLRWAVKQGDMQVFRQALADPRFNTEHKLIMFLKTAPFKENENLDMIALLIDTLSNKPVHFQQFIFEEIFTNAIYHDAITVTSFLLNKEIYSPFIARIPQDRISRLYWFVVEQDLTPPYRREEMSALLNTHFSFKSKAQLISEYITDREPDKIKPYLDAYIHTEEELVALIGLLSKKGLLESPDKKSKSAGSFILKSIAEKFETDINNKTVPRSFDKALKRLFKNMRFEYKSVILELASRVASVETLGLLAGDFKSDIRKKYQPELQKELVFYQFSSRGRDFVEEQHEKKVRDCFWKSIIDNLQYLRLYKKQDLSLALRLQKMQILIESLNVCENASFLFERHSDNFHHIEQFKEILYFLPNEFLVNLKEKSISINNKPLIYWINDIISIKSNDFQATKSAPPILTGYQLQLNAEHDLNDLKKPIDKRGTPVIEEEKKHIGLDI